MITAKYCHAGNAAQHCRLGLFQDADFAGDLGESKINIRRSFCAFLEVEHLYQSVGCAKSKRQCRTESEITHRWTLDCVWMDYLLSTSGIWSLKYCERLPNYGSLALTCGIWQLKCWERLQEYQNMRAHGKPVLRPKVHPRLKQVLDQNVDLSNIDQVPSNAHLSEK